MLNPALEVERLAANFALSGRIQIHDILVPEAAESLYHCLVHEVPWGFAFTDGERSRFLHADEIAGFGQTAWMDLVNKSYRPTGKYQFRFAYNSYMMVEAHKQQRDPGLLLHHVLEFVNSAEFLDCMRRVTGCADVRLAMAQATRYMPGHFLSKHNDIADKEYRRVAYVLNMTKDWCAEWGGLLQFTDEQGRVVETFMPTFNSLTLFRVPMWHHVSYVAPFAEHGRYAITGWGLTRSADA
ncbi:MAG: 2OG-Fe(II) oxygenase [Gammaproteobacteria bacterium]